MPDREPVDILLATYNGGEHLVELLDSLRAQTHPDVTVLVRDDGSTDQTVEIVRRVADDPRGPALRLVEAATPDQPPLGPGGNFGRLLTSSTASRVMFCDQDDVWLPEKVSRTLDRLARAEEQLGPDTPLLVHTDLAVVDEDLRPVAPSLWAYQNIRPAGRETLAKLLVQNVVTGCTAMLNRPLIERIGHIPPPIRLHDWWAALVAAAFGRVVHLPEATALYRQHPANDTGARRWSPGYLLDQLAPSAARRQREALDRTFLRARLLRKRYRRQLPPHARRAVLAYLRLRRLEPARRRLAALAGGYTKVGWLRTAGMLRRL
jgi:glycosyltransferase involved in cell wall biosynthesis